MHQGVTSVYFDIPPTCPPHAPNMPAICPPIYPPYAPDVLPICPRYAPICPQYAGAGRGATVNQFSGSGCTSRHLLFTSSSSFSFSGVTDKIEKIEKPCQILQDWHKNMIRSVQPNNHRIDIHLAGPVIVWLHRSDHVFVPILKNLTSPIFVNIVIFGPSTASTGPKSSCGTPSVLHEIDQIEQPNMHDRPENFQLPKFMMKTASLQKVKIF